MKEPSVEVACARCGDASSPETVDSSGWCDACRHKVIRRATIAAGAAVAITAILLVVVLGVLVRVSPQFLVVWVVLVAGACFVLFKLVRRVAFEWYRARAASSGRR